MPCSPEAELLVEAEAEPQPARRSEVVRKTRSGTADTALQAIRGLPALRELFPMKLVGGFIALDQALGCGARCSFCLSRRHPLWRAVLRGGVRKASAFESPAEAYQLLDASLPFKRAKVPVRFGHNTDARFQWDFGVRLYQQFPRDNPFILMTRYPLAPGDEALFQKQPNLLLKLTITPPSQILRINSPVKRLLESVGRVPAENLYVLIGPLVEDNLAGAETVIDALPEGTWADVKVLTTSGLPHLAGMPIPDPSTMARLRARAADRGITMTDYFGCRFRRRLGRNFYKADVAPGYVREACLSCFRHDACYGSRDFVGWEARVREAAREIGLELGRATPAGASTIQFACSEPASRGDETYLSELTGGRVVIDSVPQGTQGGSFSIEDERVLERWERVGMFPTAAVARKARELQHALEREWQVEE